MCKHAWPIKLILILIIMFNFFILFIFCIYNVHFFILMRYEFMVLPDKIRFYYNMFQSTNVIKNENTFDCSWVALCSNCGSSGRQVAVEFFLTVESVLRTAEEQQGCSATKPEAPAGGISTNILIIFYLLAVI